MVLTQTGVFEGGVGDAGADVESSGDEDGDGIFEVDAEVDAG